MWEQQRHQSQKKGFFPFLCEQNWLLPFKWNLEGENPLKIIELLFMEMLSALSVTATKIKKECKRDEKRGFKRFFLSAPDFVDSGREVEANKKDQIVSWVSLSVSEH
jgi:hypothetical protein